MRYSKEFIDEVLECYLRVNNISYVSRKYNLNLHTVRYWIEQYEKEQEIQKYAEELAHKAQVVQYFDEVGDYDLVSEKFGIARSKVEKVLEEFKEELHFKTPDYKRVKRDLVKLLSVFTKAYNKNKSGSVLEKIVQVELCLGKSDDYVKEHADEYTAKSIAVAKSVFQLMKDVELLFSLF